MHSSYSEERPDGNQGERTTAPISAVLLLDPVSKTAPRELNLGGGSSLLFRTASFRGDADVIPGRGSSAARRGRRPGAREATELAHDARNLLSALSLYCELLASPGVLTPDFRHYAEDLRVVGEAGLRLVEALAGPARGLGSNPRWPLRRRPFPGIEDLGAEVLAMQTSLRALAGPAVELEVECAPCAGLLALNAEELLRILFNLVANSVEAMGAPGAASRRALLRITAQRGGGGSFLSGGDGIDTVVLSVRDTGPGIAAKDLERIFDPGFSTRAGCGEAPRGLGLAIVRQLVEGAGGAVRAVSSPGLGTRFDIDLPVLAERMAVQPEFTVRGGQREQSKPSKG